jgi:hypothetical protein
MITVSHSFGLSPNQLAHVVDYTSSNSVAMHTTCNILATPSSQIHAQYFPTLTKSRLVHNPSWPVLNRTLRISHEIPGGKLANISKEITEGRDL